MVNEPGVYVEIQRHDQLRKAKIHRDQVGGREVENPVVEKNRFMLMGSTRNAGKSSPQ